MQTVLFATFACCVLHLLPRLNPGLKEILCQPGRITPIWCKVNYQITIPPSGGRPTLKLLKQSACEQTSFSLVVD